jgi:NTP pyrophosphatase (non-canonical NTP hydrolase)
MDNVQNAQDFQSQGRRTWTTDPHPSLTRGWELLQDIDRATRLLDGSLDEHKRALFYGDDSAKVLRGTPGEDHMLGKLDQTDWDFMHSGLGITTEAGEVLEEIEAALASDGEIDQEAVKEELGDLLYYVARAADTAGTTLLEIMQANNRKLRERFPEEFTSEDAMERDTDAEKEALVQ